MRSTWTEDAERRVLTSPVRVVLDTNVAVALEVFADPQLAPLAAWWNAGAIVALVDGRTLAEFARVLRYPEMRLDETTASAIAAGYAARCTVLSPDSQSAIRAHAPLPVCRDPDDQKFLELAARGNADWLITRDKALLRLKKAVRFAIATPEEMIRDGRNRPVAR